LVGRERHYPQKGEEKRQGKMPAVRKSLTLSKNKRVGGRGEEVEVEGEVYNTPKKTWER